MIPHEEVLAASIDVLTIVRRMSLAIGIATKIRLSMIVIMISVSIVIIIIAQNKARKASLSSRFQSRWYNLPCIGIFAQPWAPPKI